MIGLGLEVEAFRKVIVWENSPLGARVSVDPIGQDGELGIFEDSAYFGSSRILLTLDLRVIDMSGSTF